MGLPERFELSILPAGEGLCPLSYGSLARVEGVELSILPAGKDSATELHPCIYFRLFSC